MRSLQFPESGIQLRLIIWSPPAAMPIVPQQSRAIAQLLGRATLEILWHGAAHDLLAVDLARQQLRCRVGAGQATYYRRLGQREHLINYGSKMVASKHDRQAAAQWLTGREILQRGYFGGELSLGGLLAHTCCHEFGHVLQSLSGGLARGSIHNRAFYGIVDRIHARGLAEDVRRYIEEQARLRGLTLAFSPDPGPKPAAEDFEPGELVCFEYRGKSVTGEVLRVNRQTVNVKPLRPALPADYFRISPRLLSRHHQG